MASTNVSMSSRPEHPCMECCLGDKPLLCASITATAVPILGILVGRSHERSIAKKIHDIGNVDDGTKRDHCIKEIKLKNTYIAASIVRDILFVAGVVTGLAILLVSYGTITPTVIGLLSMTAFFLACDSGLIAFDCYRLYNNKQLISELESWNGSATTSFTSFREVK